MWRSSPFVVSLGESTPSECEEFDVPARTQTLLDIDLLALTPLSLTAPLPGRPLARPAPTPPSGSLGMAGVVGTEPRGEGKVAGRAYTCGSSGA
jgi:hypothetical protein